MSLKLITAPTAEPISLEEAKAHLRVEISDDDILITAMIVAAREAAEAATRRALMPQTWELALPAFPGCADEFKIRLPKAPLASVASLKYVDADGALLPMDSGDYMLDEHSQPAEIVPAFGTSWPSTRGQPNAVLVRYDAGYADAASVPGQIKAWMLLRIGMLYENRESVTGMTLTELPFVDRMLDAYKVWGL
jgi:uncharacterized phiE125 gp8 family phage protein